MISKGRKRGTTRFSIDPGEGARKVFLAGDFNNWTPKRMQRQKNGAFVAIVLLPPGEYQYKFVVDGRWVTDPDNPCHAANPYGTRNSIIWKITDQAWCRTWAPGSLSPAAT